MNTEKARKTVVRKGGFVTISIPGVGVIGHIEISSMPEVIRDMIDDRIASIEKDINMMATKLDILRSHM